MTNCENQEKTNIKKFYYQLKCKERNPYTGRIDDCWSSAFFKGIVKAENSKTAREFIKKHILDNEIKKDNNLLLSIIEIKPGSEYLEDFFAPRVCKHCGTIWTPANNEYYGLYCCRACYEQAMQQIKRSEDELFISSDWDSSYPVIYRIFDRKNNKNYVGQTIRAFTLRWWEHYKNWIQRVENTNITDFEFSVLEIFPQSIDKKILSEREQYWIEKYDALISGYNSRNEVQKCNN